MGITETVENDPLKFAIWFRKYKSTDIYVCHAESVDTKEHWVQVLKDVIAIQAILQNRCTLLFFLFVLVISVRNKMSLTYIPGQ